ncbi:MAG: lysoplasmalogenase family protein [Pseudomonadota bacterium]
MSVQLSRSGWMLLGLSVLGAFTYGAFARDWALHEAHLWARAALKTSGVALLVVVALSQRASALLVSALALGALGDALLALDGQAAFLLGALAFLLGHLLYTTLFLRAGGGFAAISAPARLATMASVVLAAVACAALLWPHDVAGVATSAIYTLALTAMVLSTLTLPWARWLVMAGAVLFFVSDILLTWQTNKPPRDPALLRLMSDASWFTYYFAQAGLCLGALTLKART